jgi:hypothetical protein
MRRGLIQTYITIGLTFGFILVWPQWAAALKGRDWPRDWAEAGPLLLTLARAAGHGVLRSYSWLPSMIYHVGTHKMTFVQWLFDGW